MYVKSNIHFSHIKQNKPPSVISGCFKMLMQAHSSGMDTGALHVMRVWFWFAPYAKDVSTVGTLSSALTKPKLK